MTKEEKQKAINALRISAPVMAVTHEEFNTYIQTINTVIDWLEQKPCEDTVNRQMVKDTIFAECSGTKLDIDFAKVLILQRAIKALPPVTPQTKWIPVSERLPEEGRQVLCCNKHGSVFTSALTYIYKNKYGHKYAYFGKHYEVVAWMPLPQPYKAESEET